MSPGLAFEADTSQVGSGPSSPNSSCPCNSPLSDSMIAVVDWMGVVSVVVDGGNVGSGRKGGRRGR